MPGALRFEGETDEKFRQRAERAARIGRILVDACLANVWVQDLIADKQLPHYTKESFRLHPVVRLDYDEACAIATIGDGLAMTKSKAWGNGPRILPLEPEDYVDPMYLVYVYKPSSWYNRRFEQRKRLKELLGRRHRPLVERAKHHRHTKAIFLEGLTSEEEKAIRRILHVDPGTFWRACRGKIFLDLPPRMVQLELFES